MNRPELIKRISAKLLIDRDEKVTRAIAVSEEDLRELFVMAATFQLSSPLATLGSEINEINRANDWDVNSPSSWPDGTDTVSAGITKTRKLGSDLMLIVTEVAEAMEGLRHRDRDNFEEELADTLIRTLDVATGLGVDMDAVVAKKLAKNRTRGSRHGGKAV